VRFLLNDDRRAFFGDGRQQHYMAPGSGDQ